MSTPDDLHLLGLAEQLSVLEVSLGDPADEALVSRLLDRCTDAIVDVVAGRQTLSRGAPPRTAAPDEAPYGAPPIARAESTEVDAASCSALATRCHRTAHLLDGRPEQALAGPVADCLRTIADSLQRLVQDLGDQSSTTARQHLRRGLRRAAAQLDSLTPKVAP